MTLTAEAEDFFAAVRAGLDAAGVAYELAPHLVRGLDYYRHTAFEFVTDQLGAQGTVIAGGRYDGLIEQLGGPHTPAVGWAAGIERLAMLIEAPTVDQAEVIIVPDYDQSNALAFEVLALLRLGGIKAEMAYSGSEKKRFEKAKKAKASRVLTVEIGDDSYIGALRLRDLDLAAKPVRRRVIDALSLTFVVNDDRDETTRYITLEKRVS